MASPNGLDEAHTSPVNQSLTGKFAFEGLVNARDVGGRPIATGGTVRTGLLYRSETPQLMTPDDIARAVDGLGLCRVIDLRGSRRGGSGPIGDDGRGVVIDFFELMGGLDKIDPTAEGFLSSLLDGGGAAIGRIYELLVEADGPCLVHCHTGKDRTGFVVAVTLALLGVPTGHIIADYERTIPVFDAMMANLADAGLGVPDIAPVYARDAPSPAGIRRMLARLSADWPTPAVYLADHDVAPELIDEVIRRLTVRKADGASTS